LRDPPKTPHEAFLRHRADIFTLNKAWMLEAAFRWLDPYVQRDALPPCGYRYHNDKPRRTMIESIYGYY